MIRYKPIRLNEQEKKALRAILKEKGLHEKDIAEYLEMTRGCLSNKKTGRLGRGFTPDEARKIYEYLGQDPRLSSLMERDSLPMARSGDNYGARWARAYGAVVDELRNVYHDSDKEGKKRILGELEKLLSKFSRK
jgi:transcriptional regulator with XRE-family HTH domain